MKKSKKSLFIVLMSLLISGLALSVGVTYAIYRTIDKGEQTFKSTAGERKKTMFLECITGGQNWNYYGNEKFYAGVFKSNSASYSGDPGVAIKFIQPSTTATITVSGHMSGSKKLFVFEFDTVAYNRIFFLRVGSNASIAENASYSTAIDTAWGYTEYVTNTSTYNFFSVYEVASGELYRSHWWTMSTSYVITG